MTAQKTSTTHNAHIEAPSFLRHQMVAWLTISRKESVRILRIWKMTVMPPIITVFLFCIVFGQIIGGKIGGISGVSYLQFIIPGLIMNIVINESFNNNASSIMIDKYNKSIETMVTSPVHEMTILLGYFSGCVVRVCYLLAPFLLCWCSGLQTLMCSTGFCLPIQFSLLVHCSASWALSMVYTLRDLMKFRPSRLLF